MNRFISAAVVLAGIAVPAFAAEPAKLDHDKVIGMEVFSSDGQSIGNVVDALVAPDGNLVAVAVVDPHAPRVGLALPAELLILQQGRLTANISTDEIAALPDPDTSSGEVDDTPEPEVLPDGTKQMDQ
jgi:hypothetical protein